MQTNANRWICFNDDAGKSFTSYRIVFIKVRSLNAAGDWSVHQIVICFALLSPSTKVLPFL